MTPVEQLLPRIAPPGRRHAAEAMTAALAAAADTADPELVLLARIGSLADEARRWQRRWAGAVATSRIEHARAETYRTQLALEQHR